MHTTIFNVLRKSLLCSPTLHLYNQNSQNCNIVRYYYNSFLFKHFLNVIYFLWCQSWVSSIITPVFRNNCSRNIYY